MVFFFMKSIIAVLLLIICIALSQSADAQGDKGGRTFTQQGQPWTELIFEGSKFLTSTTVKFKISSGDQLSEDLIAELEKDLGDCSGILETDKLLTVETSSRSVGFIQNQYEEKIWFKEKTLRSDMRLRLSNGDSPWVKSYCWGEKGVRRQKISPGDPSENKQPPAKWRGRTVSFYAYPEGVIGCDTISDPSLVLYLLSTVRSARLPKYFEMCVFGRKQLHRLTIEQKKYPSLKVSYKARLSSKEVAVEEKITPAVFSITAEALAPDEGELETFSLLGLNKDILIYTDREKRLPVRITGTNNTIGGIVLDLKVYSK